LLSPGGHFYGRAYFWESVVLGGHGIERAALVQIQICPNLVECECDLSLKTLYLILPLYVNYLLNELALTYLSLHCL
jgi:hypothetical protein